MKVNSTLKKVLDKTATELHVTPEVVEAVYKLYWKWIKNVIETSDIRSVKTEEDFYKVTSTINLPGLGKLYCSIPRTLYLNTKLPIDYKNEKTEDIHSESSNAKS